MNNWIPGADIVPLVKEIENPVGIEIGLDRGVTSSYLLENLPTLKLYGIDPYLPYVDWGNQKTIIGPAKEIMIKAVSPYGDRFTHYEMLSNDAVKEFADESVDFVFIDGCHTYDQVLTDCRNYWSKVKPGGVFAGHDFRVIIEVRNAVTYFANEIGAANIHLLPQYDAWYWRKF